MTTTQAQDTMAHAGTQALPDEGTITTTHTIAVLPAAILWAAAKAASADEAKGRLCSIDIRRTDDGRIRIAAVDGHRCVRCYFTPSDRFFISSEQTVPFRVDPAAFKKKPSLNAASVVIDASGMATFVDRMGKVKSAMPWKLDSAIGEGDYANIDQIWPDTLSCNPGKAISLNSRYLADIADIASTVGRLPHLSIQSETAISPVIFTTTIDPEWLGEQNTSTRRDTKIYECEDTFIKYLVMPVQVRD